MRELWERGERTDGGCCVRDVVRVPRAGGAAFARLVFFNTGRVSGLYSCSFSLSVAIWISGLMFFFALVGAGCGCRIGEGRFIMEWPWGSGGRGFGAGISTVTVFLGGDARGICCFLFVVASCCCINSPMVILRVDRGMRLTRLSIRALRSAHWRAYPARSCRARSVTGVLSAMGLIWGKEARLLSSCRLSINACFCCCVILIFLCAGLPVGVTAPTVCSSISSDFLLCGFVGAMLRSEVG